MLFFRRFCTSKPKFSAPVSPGESFFAIGDIHGRDDLLARLLTHLDDTDPAIRRVFVGDYVDRGEKSAAVLDRLRALQSRTPNTICLLGNHEQMLLDFLESPARNSSRWLRYGGLQTLASYSIPPVSETAPDEKWEEVRDRLREAMGAGTEAWIKGLPTLWQTGNVAVLHAGADPALPRGYQDPSTLIWGHPDFETTPRRDDMWVVHGHTIVETPAAGLGRISTDTGAYATGVLTAAWIRPGSVDFIRA
jgi:serine/threonine protein phosphatase 1